MVEGSIYSGHCLYISFLIRFITLGKLFNLLTRIFSTKFVILASLSAIILLRVITSVFFLSLDCCADTIFLHFYLYFTSILSILAVANFYFRSAIFLLAWSKYFFSFSLFLPLLLPFGATLADEEPPSESSPDSDALGTFRASFFLAAAVLTLVLDSAFASLFLTAAAGAGALVSGTKIGFSSYG
jgi:hypothetical protein